MGIESKQDDLVVLGRGIAPQDRSIFTIQDRISLVQGRKENCLAQDPKVKMQKEIDELTTASETLGMDSSYVDYLSLQKE